VPDADAARRVRRILILATAALFVLRVGMSLARAGPVLMADEGGYLGNARLIGGGLDFVMGSSPFYRAGYSVLLSPLVALGAGPGTTYNLVLVANAALAASLVPLLYLLLTRCFEVAPSYALGGAIAGAAYPTVTSISQVALSESALFPLTVVWLFSVGMLLSATGRRAVWWGLAPAPAGPPCGSSTGGWSSWSRSRGCSSSACWRVAESLRRPASQDWPRSGSALLPGAS
jgi:hypothetical protein